MRALIDTCVITDALEAREPFFDGARDLLVAEANGGFEGVVTSGSVLEICDVMKRGGIKGPETREHIARILRLFEVCGTEPEDLEEAVFSQVPGFREAVVSAAAERAGAERIVTRNTDEFRHSKIKAVSPEDFLKELKNKE